MIILKIIFIIIIVYVSMKYGVIGGALGAFIYILSTSSKVFEGFAGGNVQWGEAEMERCREKGGGRCITWDESSGVEPATPVEKQITSKNDHRIIYLKALIIFHVSREKEKTDNAFKGVLVKSQYEKKGHPGWVKKAFFERMHESIYDGSQDVQGLMSFENRWANLKKSLQWGTVNKGASDLMTSAKKRDWNPLIDLGADVAADVSWSSKAKEYYNKSICTNAAPTASMFKARVRQAHAATPPDGLSVKVGDVLKVDVACVNRASTRCYGININTNKAGKFPKNAIVALKDTDPAWEKEYDLEWGRLIDQNKQYCWENEKAKKGIWLAYFFEEDEESKDYKPTVDLNFYIFLSYLFNLEDVQAWYERENIGLRLNYEEVEGIWEDDGALQCQDASGQISNCNGYPGGSTATPAQCCNTLSKLEEAAAKNNPITQKMKEAAIKECSIKKSDYDFNNTERASPTQRMQQWYTMKSRKCN